MDVKSDENIIMLAVDDWWITDMYSFTSGNPAMQFISAIENTEIFQLQKNDFDQLLVKIPAFERFFRILMQNAYIREQLRVIQNLSMPAEKISPACPTCYTETNRFVHWRESGISKCYAKTHPEKVIS